MTPFAEGTLLRAARHASVTDVDNLAGGGVLVLAPHPDDETLGCGAALAAAVLAGHAAHVIAVTDGDGSHPGSRSWPRKRIAARRARELEAALAELGDGHITHERLGCRDQGVPGLADPAGGEVLERLLIAVLERRPAHLWTTWEGDPHIDHRACAALAGALASAAAKAAHALTLSRFAVWGRFVEADAPGAAEALLRFVPGCTVKALKRRALARHATQMSALIDDDPDGFVMPPDMQLHFVEHDELFLRSCPA